MDRCSRSLLLKFATKNKVIKEVHAGFFFLLGFPFDSLFTLLLAERHIIRNVVSLADIANVTDLFHFSFVVSKLFLKFAA
jgi:hypothetical protein